MIFQLLSLESLDLVNIVTEYGVMVAIVVVAILVTIKIVNSFFESQKNLMNLFIEDFRKTLESVKSQVLEIKVKNSEYYNKYAQKNEDHISRTEDSLKEILEDLDGVDKKLDVVLVALKMGEKDGG